MIRRRRLLPLFLPLLLLAAVFPTAAEQRISIDTEFYNTFLSGNGTDDWRYFQSGLAAVSYQNQGSRLVRGELAIETSEIGGGAVDSSEFGLKKLYIRPSFGELLFTLGKSRSTWGAGLAFNAGDVIFGSDSVDFDMTAEDPRSETAWMSNAEIPLGDFSFIEVIALPGTTEAEAEGLDALPTLSSASAGLRVSIQTGLFNIQGGYLYRGDAISGLGASGQRLFFSLEGIAPVNWHLSTSTTSSANGLDTERLKESWIISGGCFDIHTVAYVMSLSWRLEWLLTPYASFSESAAGGYGLYLYPSLSFSPRDRLSFSLSSIVSPVDISARSSIGADWNIYESLALLANLSLQSGEPGDTFQIENPSGISCSLGARYEY